MKRVGVTLSDREYRVLKQYAARYDMTMGDVLSEFARQGIHKHTARCHSVTSILVSESVPLDSRLDKRCWGELCMCCTYRLECQKGRYDGLFKFNTERFGEWEDVGKGELPSFN